MQRRKIKKGHHRPGRPCKVKEKVILKLMGHLTPSSWKTAFHIRSLRVDLLKHEVIQISKHLDINIIFPGNHFIKEHLQRIPVRLLTISYGHFNYILHWSSSYVQFHIQAYYKTIGNTIKSNLTKTHSHLYTLRFIAHFFLIFKAPRWTWVDPPLQ